MVTAFFSSPHYRSVKSASSCRRAFATSGVLSLVNFILLVVSYCSYGVLTEATAAAGGAQNLDMMRRQIDEAMVKGDYTAAISLSSKVIAAEKNPANYFKRATLYIRRKQFSNAISDLGEIIAIDPNFSKAYISRGQIHLQYGDCASANQDYSKALQLSPGEKTASAQQPKAARCEQDLHNANQYENHLEHYPSDTNILQHAIASLTSALQVAHESPSLLLRRARLYFKNGDFHDALVDTRTLLQIDKKDLEALAVRGHSYYMLGEHDTALNHFKEGLRLDPEHRLCKTLIKKVRLFTRKFADGEEKLNAGKHEQAAKLFIDAMKLDPTPRVFLTTLQTKICVAWTAAAKADQAVPACDKLVQMNENDADAYVKRADAYMVAEKYQEAINDYTKAQQIDQNNGPAREGLQRAQIELKKAGRKDYYKILGVSKTATSAEIKKKFRKLALKHHPDKVKGDEEKAAAELEFRKIGEAYEVLFDAEKRGKYDRGEDVEPNQGNGGGGFNPFGQGFPFQQQQGGNTFTFNFG